jgi:hypothetical protein
MAQIRGTAGYNLGGQTTFGASNTGDAMNDPSPLDQIREQTGKIEDFLDTLSDPVKPYVSLLCMADPAFVVSVKELFHNHLRLIPT